MATEMSLPEQTTRRLLLAGFSGRDPAVRRIREWNACLPHPPCTWPACPEHGRRR